MTTTSIIVVLAILLTIGVVRSTRKEEVQAEDPNTPSPVQEETQEALDPQPEFDPSWVASETIEEAPAPVEKPAAKKTSAKKEEAPKKATSKKTTVKKTAAKKTPAKKSTAKKSTK